MFGLEPDLERVAPRRAVPTLPGGLFAVASRVDLGL